MPRHDLHLPTTPDPSKLGTEHLYFKTDGSVNGLEVLEMVNATPGVYDLVMLRAIMNSRLSRGMPPEVLDIVSGLCGAVLKSILLDDERAKDQIKALHKIAQPEIHEVPRTKIKEIAERYETSPPLARGWELRRVMSHIAEVLEPLKSNETYSINCPVRLVTSTSKTETLKLVQSHFKPNSTVQSLAIRIYLEYLQEAGIATEARINAASLKRDLLAVRDWEDANSNEEKTRRGFTQGFAFSPTDRITWCDFSEGWKKRRQDRNSPTKLLTPGNG